MISPKKLTGFKDWCGLYHYRFNTTRSYTGFMSIVWASKDFRFKISVLQ